MARAVVPGRARKPRLGPTGRRPMSPGAPPRSAGAGPPAFRLRTDAAATPSPSLPRPVAETVRSPGAGEPLPAQVRAPLEASLGFDLRPVRVYRDPRAQTAATGVNARAFTFGNRIFLGPGERPTDLGLVAHEVVHVVQQQRTPAVQLFARGGAEGSLEREAAGAAAAVAAGEPAVVGGRTGEARIQRQERSALDIVGEFAAEVWEAGTEFVVEQAWALVRKYAPWLVPILEKGPFEWLRERITAALEQVFDALMAPVRGVTGFIDSLVMHFGNLVQWTRDAAAKIAKGDCSSIAEAAEKIQQVVQGIAAPIIDKVKELGGSVKEFFARLWDRVGAPAWDFLKEVGGAVWETIKDVAAMLWDSTKPIRDALAAAWDWIKEKLGIGEGPEGQNGLLQWVQAKASEAWGWIKEKLEPYKKQLMVVAGIAVALSPAGPILAVGAGIYGLIKAARWLATRLGQSGSVVEDRGLLEGTIIPGIMSAVTSVSETLTKTAGSLAEKIGGVVGELGKAVGAVAGSVFRFAVRLLQWLLDKFKALAAWAVEKVKALAEWVKTGLQRLHAWAEPLLAVLRRIRDVVADVLNIVKLILEKAWNLIPACIKNPVIEFLKNQILKRIPIFSSLLEIPDIWAKVKGVVEQVIKKVFTDGDLKGAAITVFRFVLDVLQVPVDLVKQVWAKAGAAFDMIVAAPIRFLRTFLMAVWGGFKLFLDNILKHLLKGVLDWFAAQLGEAGIVLPTEWSFFNILKLILQIAGITMEKIWAILAKKVAPDVVEKLKKGAAILAGAWEWISVAIKEGPAGLWKKLQDFVGNLKDMLIDSVVDWIMGSVVGTVIQKILTALNPVGAIINALVAVYKALQTAVQYLKQILEIVNSVLDIVGDLARGVWESAAPVLESALARALPVAIGFFANYLGFGRLGPKVKEMVEKLQKNVEKGLEWLIDKAIAIGKSFLDVLGAGGKAAGNEVAFTEDSGARHRVFTTPDAQPDILVESTARTVAAQLAVFEPQINTDLAREEEKKKARDALDAAKKDLQALKQAKPPQPGAMNLSQLAQNLKILYSLLGHPEVPESVVHGLGGPRGTHVWAEPLTRKAGAVKGSEDTSGRLPAEAETKMAQMNAAKVSPKGYPSIEWVKMHLLSARLHGPGSDPSNLTPGTQLANNQMLSRAEDPVIQLLESGTKNAILWYDVNVKFRVDEGQTEFPERIDIEWGDFDVKESKRSTTNRVSPPITVPPPVGGRLYASLSEDGEDNLTRIGRLKDWVARAIVVIRERAAKGGRLPTGKFESEEQLLTLIYEAPGGIADPLTIANELHRAASASPPTIRLSVEG